MVKPHPDMMIHLEASHRSEGNLVYSINDQNPSRMLLDTIAKLDSTTKDDTYFIGVYPLEPFSADSTPVQLYNIMSGDPSRGTIALEGDSSPVEGERIQASTNS